MKKITVLVSIFAALSLLVALDSCQSSKSAGAAKMLKFDLEKGKAYDYETIINMDQEIMGQSMKIDMSTYYSMHVRDDEGGTKSLAATIDRFRMKTAIAGFNIDVDTDKPYVADSNDVMGQSLGKINKVFGAIKGRKFDMKVSPEGKIVSVTGFETMASSIADSLGLDASERVEMMKEFQSQFNEKEFRQSFERVWYIFPNKEVKVGDTWTKTTEMDGKLPGKYNSTYKVTDIEGDMVTLEEDSKIEGLKTDDDVDLSGDITGTIVVDSRSGLVVSADQDMKLKASTKGMSFDIKGKTKTKGTAR